MLNDTRCYHSDFCCIIIILCAISTAPFTNTTTIIPVSSMMFNSDVTSTANDGVTSIGTGIVTLVTSTPGVSSSTVTAANAQSSSDSSDGSSVGIIVGCIIGVVLCITLLLLVVILLWYFSRRRKGKLELSQGKSNKYYNRYVCMYVRMYEYMHVCT